MNKLIVIYINTEKSIQDCMRNNDPNSKVHGANMGPIWGRQDPGGPHVGPMNFVIWGCISLSWSTCQNKSGPMGLATIQPQSHMASEGPTLITATSGDVSLGCNLPSVKANIRPIINFWYQVYAYILLWREVLLSNVVNLRKIYCFQAK